MDTIYIYIINRPQAVRLYGKLVRHLSQKIKMIQYNNYLKIILLYNY
jgi:hypothetical protein